LGGELLYKAEGGGTNLNSNPRQAVAATLASLFASAYSAGAGIEAKNCDAGFAGTAGVDRFADRDAFAQLVREAAGVSCPVAAGNDAEAALVGALGDAEGFLLIAGTGSIAYGRARDGTQVRSGGWGHILGDEGSAYRISLDAVARSLRSLEGRDMPTTLLSEALSFFEVDEPADLIRVFYNDFDKAAIARFARVVCKARDRGDALARDLFDTAARELAGLVVSVNASIGPRLEKRRLAIKGGLVEGDAELRTDLERRLRTLIPGIEIAAALADAATGACALARALSKGELIGASSPARE
jgi:N-acetylglucosamine kinase-like BadF-type ATPase